MTRQADCGKSMKHSRREREMRHEIERHCQASRRADKTEVDRHSQPRQADVSTTDKEEGVRTWC